MYKINTPAAYLVKGDEKLKLGEGLYDAKTINGFKSVSHRVRLVNTKTNETKTLFPGEAIKVALPRKKKQKKAEE